MTVNSGEVFGFQNPSDGFPFVLRFDEDQNKLVVECEDQEGFDQPSDSTRQDAMELTRAVQGCKDIHDAVDLLISNHSCDIV